MPQYSLQPSAKVRQPASQWFGQPVDVLDDLGQGHEPRAVMVTCCHLGCAPDQVSHAEPGEFYIVQNAGSVVPDPAEPVDSTLASLELGLQYETVSHLIVCGHTSCGFVRRPLVLQQRETFRSMRSHSNPARSRGGLNGHRPASGEQQVRSACQHVLQQLEKLARHPFIAERLEHGALTLHGWLVGDETSQIRYYNPGTSRFELQLSGAR